MSIWSRLKNTIRLHRLSSEIDEELETHVVYAIEDGYDPDEARRLLGSTLKHREASLDVRLVTRVESLASDAVFGWRQINKNRLTSAAAILSLGLSVGACMAAFRLIDALFLRPLPIHAPDRLYVATVQVTDRDGKITFSDGLAYPLFRRLATAAGSQANVLAGSFTERVDLTYNSDADMEKAHRQFVSGAMFESFGVTPAVGRVLGPGDDKTPGAHPYAVLSEDYWTRRFGRDPQVVGRTLRLGQRIYEIVGVTRGVFTGTEPGTMVDIFVPASMHEALDRDGHHSFRALVHLHPGVEATAVRDRFVAPFREFQQHRVNGFTGMPEADKELYLGRKILLQPAAAGLSSIQGSNKAAWASLAALVSLVLFIACANLANLMSARAAARAREMALRVAIGAGRTRLVQLVVLESAWLSLLAAFVGAVFAWWSAPFVAGLISPPNNPARLHLPADWRVLGFGATLTFAVTFLFGLLPALRASGIKPASALKGGDNPHARRRLMHALICAQVAFCFVVLFTADLFVSTHERLANQPTGFSPERLLTLETVTSQPQISENWRQVAEHVRRAPGVQTVAMSSHALMGGHSWNEYISINGGPPEEALPYFLQVSSGWMDAMKIPFVAGRDFTRTESAPGPAIVNEAFAKHYFGGQYPLGKSFERTFGRVRYQIVGVVRNARYASPREPMTPTVFVPLDSMDASGSKEAIRQATLIVRTTVDNSNMLASSLREHVRQARSGFRVSNIRSQEDLIRAHTTRERLLATLAVFFSVVALLLAGVGLYGVLDYSVQQRRREIGIRMALGAPARNVVRHVTSQSFAMVVLGAFVGITLSLASQRYFATLIYGVKGTDVAVLAVPVVAILAAAAVATTPAVMQAVRIDPAKMLREE